MSFDTSLVNNVQYAAASTVVVNAVNNLGGGNYSVDSSEYGGAFTDYWGPNPLLAPGIITFSYTYGNGTVVSGFGGDVIAYNAHDILVQVIDGFVGISQTAGTYVGTPDTGDYVILAGYGQDLSYEANGGNGPNLPITFGQTGSFSVPEPSAYALVLVALVATTIARTPLVRRFLRGFQG
jgi:hypothetical protein